MAHLTVLDADPLTFIDAAAAAGFDAIGLRLVAPPATDPWPFVGDDPELLRGIQARLADSGISILDVETFWLSPESSVAELLPALDVGAQLGARYVLVVGNDPEPSRLVQTLGALCAAAAPLGLKAMLEFMPFSHTRTLQAAVEIVAQVRQPNAGVLIDALHVARSGGTPADVQHVDPALLDYWQICDAPATGPGPDELRTEARTRRLVPGEGGLPLSELLRVMPGGRPISVEVPSIRLQHHPPIERARVCAQATRALLERAYA